MAEQVITTVFMGQNMLGPVTNEISGQLNNLGRTMQRTGQTGSGAFGVIDREWQTFQRHLRYAVAGFGTYEIFNAITRLRDYQNELGMLNSTLGETPQQLNEFGRTAIDISLKTATPLNDVLQSMNNIAASIPNMSKATRQHLIPAMAQIEAMGARISGIAPQSFGATVLALARAFVPSNILTNEKTAPGALERIASQVITVQKRIPNPAGAQAFYSALPMLAGGAFTGGFSLEQALAMFTVAQRVIQRPQTTAQYLRQLMIRLHAPPVASKPFFAQAGLTPDVMANMTGPQILNSILLHALSLPGANLHGATPEQFMRTGSYRSLTQRDISGQSAEFIQKTIGGRIQSFVAARALIGGLQQLPVEENALRNAVNIQTRFNRALQLMPMQQAQQAMSDMVTSITLNFEPGIDAVAQGMTQLSKATIDASKFLQRRIHDPIERALGGGRLGSIAGGTAEIGLMAGGAMLFRRMFRGTFATGTAEELAGKIGPAASLMRRLPFMRRFAGTSMENIIGAPLLAERPQAEVAAAQAALAGQANGTYYAPFWVVIHPLSKSQVPELFNRGPLPPGSDPFKGAGEGAGAATVASRLRKFIASRAAARAIGGTGAAEAIGGVAAAGATAILGGAIAGGIYIAAHDHPVGTAGPGGYSIYKDALGYYYAPPHVGNRKIRMTQQQAESALGKKLPRVGDALAGSFIPQLGSHDIPRGLQPYFSAYESGRIPAARLNQAIANYSRHTAIAVARSGGRADPLQQAIIGMFRLTQGHQLRLTAPPRTNNAQGYVEATLNLEPTQAFANLLQPQQVKVHIPIGQGQPAPRSRARKNTRTR